MPTQATVERADRQQLHRRSTWMAAVRSRVPVDERADGVEIAARDWPRYSRSERSGGGNSVDRSRRVAGAHSDRSGALRMEAPMLPNFEQMIALLVEIGVSR
jgi:hypothetical protein